MIYEKCFYVSGTSPHFSAFWWGGAVSRPGSSRREKHRKEGDPSRRVPTTEARAAAIGWDAGLRRVYGGNIPGEDEDTGCPHGGGDVCQALRLQGG